MIRTAVLIVTYKSRDTLPRLRDALAIQTVAPDRIYVLENGSPANERAEASLLPSNATLTVSETNIGYAAGNNLLAKKAAEDAAEWLVLLNPDAFPEPDWLERLLNATELYPYATIFGCTQKAYEQVGILDGCGDVYFVAGVPYRGGYGRMIEPPPTGESFAACGASLMIRRDVFERLGGFDEDFFCYVEDVDLCFRARLQGETVIQLSETAIAHVGYGSSGRRSEFATYHGTRNRFWTFCKNTPGWLLYLTAPLHIALTFALWLSSVRFGMAGVFGRALNDAIADWSGLMAKRRAVQAARVISTWQAARMMAWNPLRLITRAPHVWPPRR